MAPFLGRSVNCPFQILYNGGLAPLPRGTVSSQGRGAHPHHHPPAIVDSLSLDFAQACGEIALAGVSRRHLFQGPQPAFFWWQITVCLLGLCAAGHPRQRGNFHRM